MSSSEDQAASDRICIHCGYGVASRRAPEACPMCGGTEWEAMRRREFSYEDESLVSVTAFD